MQEELHSSDDEDLNPGVSAPRLLTVENVADRTDLSVSSIRREIRLRKLACYRIGRAIRVGEADLETFLAKRRINAR
jgi:excisionase family DNA binding protein